jgi:hypothetical protein
MASLETTSEWTTNASDLRRPGTDFDGVLKKIKKTMNHSPSWCVKKGVRRD